MPYFSNMPTIDYPVELDGKIKYINARNIVVRAKFLDYVKNSQTTFLDYTIRDGERPETLAHRIYGLAEYHWIILLFNEVINPLFSWPLATKDLELMVRRKYPGKVLYIDYANATFWYRGETKQINPEFFYEKGRTITQNDASGSVVAWNPNLYQIAYDQNSSSSFEVDSDVGSGTTQTRSLLHTRSNGVVLSASVGRVVDDHRYGVHHFIDDTTNEVVDHHSSLIDPSGNDTGTNIIKRYVLGETVIPLWNRTVRAVTNYDYEIEENEKRRKIKMMRPEFIDVVLKDIRKVFVSG